MCFREEKVVGKENKKKLLIYAHYYAPDVASTGQLLQDMAEGMLDVFDVTVICTVPSYGGKISPEYQEKKFYYEEINGVKVIRIAVPEFTKTSKVSRIKNLLAYYFGARKATKLVGEQDYIFTISQPPILGGMLGVYGKKKLKASNGSSPLFVYCIQDFNPEQVIATGYVKFKFILDIAKWMDNRSCVKSDLVVTVGRDLEQTLVQRFGKKSVPNHTIINNWVDEKEIHPLAADSEGVEEFNETYGLKDKFVIMYSGNIGLYYDLDGLIEVMAKFNGAKTPDGREVVFAFVGAGAMLKKLEEYKVEHSLNNIVFIPYQDKDKLIYSLNAADVHWCVSAKGIKGVSCPSKFYGIAGVGKPVIGVLEKGAEIEMLINEIGCGKIAEPGDYDTIEEIVNWFIDNADSSELAEMGRKAHEYLLGNLTKNLSINKYKKAMLNNEQQLLQTSTAPAESELRKEITA
ncbi:MAG: glycosyltransferase family 4 protein [Butyrivibrio sp.]|nr:glycosyltransferase family 4 protein [Butyrivibrio sp.]